jgi:hypothetical protein
VGSNLNPSAETADFVPIPRSFFRAGIRSQPHHYPTIPVEIDGFRIPRCPISTIAAKSP